MSAVAERNGSVISAVLFGALCGAMALPFNRQQFEQTIVRGGVGVKPSLKAFSAGYEKARDGEVQLDAARPVLRSARTLVARHPTVAPLLAHAQKYPSAVADVAVEGVRRLIDYQDPTYAQLYLVRLDSIVAAPGADTQLVAEVARHLALWMSYEDVIRVADLKTRGSRFTRVTEEVRLQSAQVLEIQEFMHPRLEEVIETLPAPLGRFLQRSPRLQRVVAHFTREGRVVRTSSLSGFLMLYGLARWRWGRRSTLRYQVETVRIEAWLKRLQQLAAIDPALALEAARCQRLVKGYSDTHARGVKNYELLMSLVDSHAKSLAPSTLGALRDAALADEHGHQLRASIKNLDFRLEGVAL